MEYGFGNRFAVAVILAIAVVLFFPLVGDHALAQNSLGLGRPEQAIRPEGPFAEILFWIQNQQKEFYRLMTEALRKIRAGGDGMWLLIGLSFSYGILHAAGPGHGKVVISSYMVANEVQLRRGILLSFASAILQAVVAIAAIGVLVLGLHGLGLRQSELTRWLEVASYAGVTMLGLWLLWRKTLGYRNRNVAPAAAVAASFGTQSHRHSHDSDAACGHVQHAGEHHGHAIHAAHDHDNHSHHGHVHHDHDHAHHPHVHGEVCPDCGHAHMPDPALLTGDFNLREAMSAVLAVGLRPCTGALIVLTFSFLNGLYVAGILSAFAMAVGTAITVSTIATLAVTAKNAVLRFGSDGTASSGLFRGLEIAGAMLILLMGISLLTASLYS